MSDPDPSSRWVADARAYDAWFDQPWGEYASGVEHQLLLDSAAPLAGLEVCDAGCGTGRLATRLEAAGARVTAVDRDPAALGIARTRLRGDLVEGDIQRSPFPDDTFDVTFAVTVCEFTADPAVTIGELIRITRPGGRVIIGSLNPNSPWGSWNRRQFRQPPWDTARFLDHDHLDRVARQHGTTRWRTGLYAPTALPGRWGPRLERLGRRVAPRRAAFEVIAITRPIPSPEQHAEQHTLDASVLPPLLTAHDHDEPSVFLVENLLREARRQRHLGDTAVPDVCLLDPDGDVVRHLQRQGRVTRHQDWACYHSELWVTDTNGTPLGIVPCAVGAPYAVLVAEELASSGCRLLVSVTSAGVITPLGKPPYFVLIERAWRGDGTSHRYLPPGEWSELGAHVDAALGAAFDDLDEPVHRGATWTTDAPFRETGSAIERARSAGVHAVEMEAAGLYAYAQARRRDVVCVAHVTNTMATAGDDFEKGADDGTERILSLVAAIASRCGRGPVREEG
jgi:SAM-dependent methyltransferase/uridine phosphorylase